MKGNTELLFLSDGDFYAYPKIRGSELVTFIIAAGKGEATVNNNEIVISKEPSPETEALIRDTVNLINKRKMISLKDYLNRIAPQSELIKTAEDRILKSDNIAKTIKTDSNDLNLIIKNIYDASDLCSEGKSSEVYSRFYDTVKSGFYSIELIHPEGNGYTNSGYANPFSVIVKTKDGASVLSGVMIEAVNGTGSIGANKQEYLNMPAFVFTSAEGGKTEFYINSFNAPGISIKAVSGTKNIKEMDKFFTDVYGKELVPVMPFALVPLKNVSSFASSDYERYSSESSSLPVAELESSVLSMKAAENGQFTVGGFNKGEPLDFLFGHPNGKGSDGIFSSYVSIKIDDTVFKLHDLPSNKIDIIDKNKIKKEYKALEGKIIITEIIEFSEKENYSRISFEAANKDNSPHKIGVRILLDTWAGSNDGVPFRIPFKDNKGFYQPGEVITNEMEVFGIDADYFEACELGSQDKIVIRGDFQGNKSVVPDRFVLASWVSAYESQWDYDPNPFEPVVYDSSVLIYYNPVEIKPNASRSVSFRYGLDKINDNIETPELVNTSNSVFITSVGYYNSTDEIQDAVIEVIPEDNKILSSDPSLLKVSVTVNPGRETVAYFTLKASGLDKGESVIKYRISDSTGMKEYKKTIKISEEPIIISDKRIQKDLKKLPIQFTMFKDKPVNVKLYAVVYNTRNEIVKSLEMFDDGKNEDGESGDGIYGAVVDIEGINETEITVKIFEAGDSK